MERKSMDGNEAAAYASYAFTEVATIYPITPSSPMANHVDEWAANGKKNLFGTTVKLMEMQAEYGACAAMQGALEAGALATTYTSAQGLMLMIPPMYRISGLMVPAVMHVAARSVASSTVYIFGDSYLMGFVHTVRRVIECIINAHKLVIFQLGIVETFIIVEKCSAYTYVILYKYGIFAFFVKFGKIKYLNIFSRILLLCSVIISISFACT